MKHEIALLKADIQEELSKLERVLEEFRPFASQLDLSDKEVSNYDKMVVGYLLHSFYNGCENIFRLVARVFENDIESESWYRSLLRRMKLDVPEYRPRLLSEELYACLDDFRGFRHRFRHSYSFELDWEREKVVARKLEPAFKMLKDDLSKFLAKLDSLPDS